MLDKNYVSEAVGVDPDVWCPIPPPSPDEEMGCGDQGTLGSAGLGTEPAPPLGSLCSALHPPVPTLGCPRASAVRPSGETARGGPRRPALPQLTHRAHQPVSGQDSEAHQRHSLLGKGQLRHSGSALKWPTETEFNHTWTSGFPAATLEK